MDQSLEELLQQAEQLFNEQKYQELILLLGDEVLEKHNNATLYAFKSRAYGRLKQLDETFKYAQKAIEMNPLLSTGYLERGYVWLEKNEYSKAINDFTKVIEFDAKNVRAYHNRATALYNQKEYNKAFDDYNRVIELDEKYKNAYVGLGNVWYSKKEYSKAFDDYNKAIILDEKFAKAHVGLGIVFAAQNEYDKAIDSYNKAILLDGEYALAYNNRGNALRSKKEFIKAIDDYNKAIEIDETFNYSYYNKALSYENLANYTEAINNFKRYIELTNNSEDYLTQVSLSKIEELTKNIANAWYNDVGKLISELKLLLLFDKPCLTHYTSLTAAKEMLLNNSPFRISEGTFLNDTSEGRELLKYLSFDILKRNTDETIEEYFIERPFIGSFVEEAKHNNLTLWRMYGKEAQAEAKGSSLTIDREQFIKNLVEKLNPEKNSADVFAQGNGQFTFYKVAYGSKDSFSVPGSSSEVEKQFNLKLQELKDKLNDNLVEEQKISVAKLLNDIVYLFKSAEYQYEQEVRLVVQGVGFKKEISKEAIPPKVYIELVEIAPVLQKITLGPKVERADEWAAAFNYHIKEQNRQRNENVEIVISHLPFK